MNGQVGEAIKLTHDLFPGILEKNPTLLFSLKIRQFIEMINNTNDDKKAKKDAVVLTETEATPNRGVSLNNNNHVNGNVNNSNDMDIDSNLIASSTITELTDIDVKIGLSSQNGNSYFYPNNGEIQMGN